MGGDRGARATVRDGAAIKHIKRTGHSCRNNQHYQTRILLHSAHRAGQHG